jgi:hypothetical protein
VYAHGKGHFGHFTVCIYTAKWSCDARLCSWQCNGRAWRAFAVRVGGWAHGKTKHHSRGLLDGSTRDARQYLPAPQSSGAQGSAMQALQQIKRTATLLSCSIGETHDNNSFTVTAVRVLRASHGKNFAVCTCHGKALHGKARFCRSAIRTALHIIDL